jgi:hypothetical protein
MSELDDMDDMSCDEFAEVAAELALGVLTGRERAAALAHLDGCESCREQVRELTMAGEELLALLPSHEPPAGFESRVLDRIGLAAPSRRESVVRRLADQRAKRRAGRLDHPVVRPASRPDRPSGRSRDRMRRALVAAAVVLALVGAGLGGWGVRSATAPASSSALSTAALVTADNQMAGEVFVYNRSPWWMYMSVNMDGLGNVTVKCQLESADGHFKTVGEFRLTDGYGAWGSNPYTAGPGTIMGARLLGANGTVLATATFH